MEKKYTTISFIKDIAFIAVVFVVFATFVAFSFHIPSGSMEPTLEVGDRIIVTKFDYGYSRYSAFFDPTFLPEDHVWEDAPERGDVVVFTLPYRNNTDFIKRVIGLPGDRIQMQAGQLIINDVIVPRSLVREVDYTSYLGANYKVSEYDETLPNGVVHRIYERSDTGPLDNTGIYIVPPDHYFMMGDNRDGSADSRVLQDMGYVHKKYLVGKARFTTFSLYDCDQGKEITCALGIPFGRFFNGIN